ncbi:A1pp-domain-containing protein [Artomyces pyxidatus]|uniref:A1pp-domain-containing protein n=1 Tax=Artomyces pyxidatus TaxID=48021 RepID=A0ACB8TFP6_9AGAM|nr:A1pp-domain-containing protein [Artomyces pyxidatus]
MSRIIKLDQIPRIRELFERAVLRPSQGQRRVATSGSATMLDRVSIFKGDITKVEVDAIVNAANRRLLGGGGVDGAIHRAAGPELLEECRTLNGCATGDAKITKGYDLPAGHVIHAVGPVYSSSKVDIVSGQLASCYSTSLKLAAQRSLKTIAFPSISTGIYGYPIDDATHIALSETTKFLQSEAGRGLERVVFVVFSAEDETVYHDLLPLYFPLPENMVAEEQAD